MTGRGPYRDRTRPISCSATTGISSCDQTLSEVVTGRTDDTVLRHDNVFSVTRRSGTRRPDAQSAASDRVQRGSKAAPVLPDASDQVRPDSAQSPINARALTVGTTGRVWSVAESWVLSPTATFSVGLINRPLTGHLRCGVLRKHTKGVDTPF